MAKSKTADDQTATDQAPPVLTLHPESICNGCTPTFLNGAGRCRFLALDEQLRQIVPVSRCSQYAPTDAATDITNNPDTDGESAGEPITDTTTPQE